MQKKQGIKRKTNSFTLLEIVICIAILVSAGSLIGFEIFEMIGSARFEKGIEKLLLDLEKAQALALADRCDLTCLIVKDKGKYFYSIKSDEPLKALNGKAQELPGAWKISQSKKKDTDFTIPIYSQGRIDSEALEIVRNKNKRITLTFNPIGVKG